MFNLGSTPLKNSVHIILTFLIILVFPMVKVYFLTKTLDISRAFFYILYILKSTKGRQNVSTNKRISLTHESIEMFQLNNEFE